MLTRVWWTLAKLWNDAIIHSASAFSTAKNVECGENNREFFENYFHNSITKGK